MHSIAPFRRSRGSRRSRLDLLTGAKDISMRKSVRRKVYSVHARLCAVLALACILLILLAGCERSGVPTVSHDLAETLDFGGLTRGYILHRPPSVSGALPLVLAFHGGGDTAADMEPLTRFDELADREGFLVVYPQGLDNRWADARDGATPTNDDDVGFVRALLDDLKRLIAYDPNRVYATGVSIGGFFVARLGCEAADRIAAIGIVAATIAIAEAERCAPARRVSVVTMHGTDDTFVPVDGDATSGMLSVAGAAHTWTHVDGCAAQPDVVYEPDTADDGTRVRRETYPRCADGSTVVFYIVEGGGHTWPGESGNPNGVVSQRSTRDIDATAVLWSFFQAHPLQAST
jgi:polyhydroxybutyrate depolymerase